MEESKTVKYRQRLQAELNQLTTQQTQNHHYGLEVGMNNSAGELSGYDNHPADLGTEMFERGKDLALQDATRRHMQDVIEAIARIDAGTYGKCEVCQQPISAERLDAVPWASTCADHQPGKHIPADRPVEEQVIQPYRVGEDQQSLLREDAWNEVERFGTSNPADFFANGESYNELTTNDEDEAVYGTNNTGYSVIDLSGETEEITEDELRQNGLSQNLDAD